MSDATRVFLSSTKIDLGAYRRAADNAIRSAGMMAIGMEHFAAEGTAATAVDPREVESCDAVVVIVAHCYGSIPAGQPDGLSYTWLECRHAHDRGIPIFAFVVDEAFPWTGPREKDRVMAAFESGGDLAKVGAEVKLAEQRLKDFKAWLGTGRIRKEFTTPESLGELVATALLKWRPSPGPVTPLADEAGAVQRYFNSLRESTRWIELRGLRVGSGEAHKFRIDQLYVGIKTAGGKDGKNREESQPRSVPLEEALRHPRLLIQGDAGSGKTTFVRRMVGIKAAEPAVGFPVLIGAGALDAHIEKKCKDPGSPAQRHSPQWIAHYLAAQPWGLTAAMVERGLNGSGAVVFLDGLDEAANEARRRSLVRLLQGATQQYPRCQFVATTRPQAFEKDGGVAGFEVARIEDLDDEAVGRFLELWSACLHPNNAELAGDLLEQLRSALRESVEIRRMARNPVMLTALALVHWNNKRLPEQRSELYDSVVTWLVQSREDSRKEGREIGELECLGRLGRLAWWMQTRAGGRLTSVERGEAANALAPLDSKSALAFLDAEVTDSGILVRRDAEFRYWHLTFQEYLAAREVAGFPDADLYDEVLRPARLYSPEWREVMLLLAGVLREQGPKKVNALLNAITGKVGKEFPERARCVGLISGMLRDLRPTKFQAECPEYDAMLKEMKRLFAPGGAAGLDLATRVAAAEALGQTGHPHLALPGDEAYWRTVRATKFLMGAQKDESKPNFDPNAENDEPVREVDVATFRIGRYPVTVWEYGKFVDAGGAVPDEWEDQKLHPSRPVVRVSWHHADAYCKWAGCRLPTEEEWELAARGTDGRKFPWGPGDPTDQLANVDPWGKAPTPVGMFPDGRSPYGCDDMAGNVWEWTESWYSEERQRRVVRGGSWYGYGRFARCACRAVGGPEDHFDYLGFRSARI